jgi:hypothetical protein
MRDNPQLFDWAPVDLTERVLVDEEGTQRWERIRGTFDAGAILVELLCVGESSGLRLVEVRYRAKPTEAAGRGAVDANAATEDTWLGRWDPEMRLDAAELGAFDVAAALDELARVAVQKVNYDETGRAVSVTFGADRAPIPLSVVKASTEVDLRPRPDDPGTLDIVAELVAEYRGKPRGELADAIADRLGLSTRSATRYIDRARAAGLLGEED